AGAQRRHRRPKAANMQTSFPVLLTLICLACTSKDGRPTEMTSTANAESGRHVEVRATPVPLNPEDPTQTTIGAFGYAGGVELIGVDTTRLHGLSDLRIAADGRLLAIGDEGDVLEAQIVLNPAGHLVGVSDARLTRLLDLSGHPLQDKTHSDAEGLAIFPNGDRIVSFERDDRIWLYSADGGSAR